MAEPEEKKVVIEEAAKADPAISHGDDDDDSSQEDPILAKAKTGAELTFEESVHHHELYNMREVVIHLPGGSQMRFNPCASLFAIAVLWGLAIWCMVDPKGASTNLINWRASVTELFTWFYVGTNPAFMVRY